MKNEIVKGFQDFLGKDAEKREEIRKILVKTFESYGFEPAETPVIEYEEFVKGENANDEAVSDIFKLQDKGKRNLALRYEVTFPLKRIMNNQKLPYRRYQIGPVFRDEPVGSNRFRQFTACDCDVVGATIKDDAEILSVIKTILDKLKIKFIIYINNRKLLNEILDEQGIKKKAEVIRQIDKFDKLSEKEVLQNLKKFGAESVLKIIRKNEKYFEKYKSYGEIKELKKYCRIYGIKIKFSPSLARGLSYYNGTIFEVKTREMKETILGGGSFMFNGVQATGFGTGLERLSALAKINFEKEKYLVISLNKDKEAIELAEKLREKGKSVIIYYGKPSRALDYANSKKIEKVIFVGEKEIKEKKFKIKDMKSGKEKYLKV